MPSPLLVASSAQGTPSQDRRALSTITNSPRPDSSRSRKVPDSPGSATPSDCAPPPGLASPSLQDLVTPRRAPAIASGKSNSATPHARRASRAPTLSHSAEHDVAFGGQSYQELQELRAQYRKKVEDAYEIVRKLCTATLSGPTSPTLSADQGHPGQGASVTEDSQSVAELRARCDALALRNQELESLLAAAEGPKQAQSTHGSPLASCVPVQADATPEPPAKGNDPTCVDSSDVATGPWGFSAAPTQTPPRWLMDNPLYVTPSIRGHGCSPALEPSHADGWESPVTFVLPHMDDDSDADTPGAAVDSGVAAQGAGERPTTALECLGTCATAEGLARELEELRARVAETDAALHEARNRAEQLSSEAAAMRGERDMARELWERAEEGSGRALAEAEQRAHEAEGRASRAEARAAAAEACVREMEAVRAGAGRADGGAPTALDVLSAVAAGGDDGEGLSAAELRRALAEKETLVATLLSQSKHRQQVINSLKVELEKEKSAAEVGIREALRLAEAAAKAHKRQTKCVGLLEERLAMVEEEREVVTMQLERAICRDIDLCREVASLEGCVAHLIASHACQMAVARDHLRQVAAAPDCVEGSGPLVSEAARRAWAIREAELREEIDEAAATIRRLEADLAARLAETCARDATLASMAQELEARQVMSEHADRVIAALEGRAGEAEAECERLRGEAADAEACCRALESRLAEAEGPELVRCPSPSGLPAAASANPAVALDSAAPQALFASDGWESDQVACGSPGRASSPTLPPPCFDDNVDGARGDEGRAAEEGWESPSKVLGWAAVSPEVTRRPRRSRQTSDSCERRNQRREEGWESAWGDAVEGWEGGLDGASVRMSVGVSEAVTLSNRVQRLEVELSAARDRSEALQAEVERLTAQLLAATRAQAAPGATPQHGSPEASIPVGVSRPPSVALIDRDEASSDVWDAVSLEDGTAGQARPAKVESPSSLAARITESVSNVFTAVLSPKASSPDLGGARGHIKALTLALSQKTAELEHTTSRLAATEAQLQEARREMVAAWAHAGVTAQALRSEASDLRVRMERDAATAEALRGQVDALRVAAEAAEERSAALEAEAASLRAEVGSSREAVAEALRRAGEAETAAELAAQRAAGHEEAAEEARARAAELAGALEVAERALAVQQREAADTVASPGVSVSVCDASTSPSQPRVCGRQGSARSPQRSARPAVAVVDEERVRLAAELAQANARNQSLTARNSELEEEARAALRRASSVESVTIELAVKSREAAALRARVAALEASLEAASAAEREARHVADAAVACVRDAEGEACDAVLDAVIAETQADVAAADEDRLSAALAQARAEAQVAQQRACEVAAEASAEVAAAHKRADAAGWRRMAAALDAADAAWTAAAGLAVVLGHTSAGVQELYKTNENESAMWRREVDGLEAEVWRLQGLLGDAVSELAAEAAAREAAEAAVHATEVGVCNLTCRMCALLATAGDAGTSGQVAGAEGLGALEAADAVLGAVEREWGRLAVGARASTQKAKVALHKMRQARAEAEELRQRVAGAEAEVAAARQAQARVEERVRVCEGEDDRDAPACAAELQQQLAAMTARFSEADAEATQLAAKVLRLDLEAKVARGDWERAESRATAAEGRAADLTRRAEALEGALRAAESAAGQAELRAREACEARERAMHRELAAVVAELAAEANGLESTASGDETALDVAALAEAVQGACRRWRAARQHAEAAAREDRAAMEAALAGAAAEAGALRERAAAASARVEELEGTIATVREEAVRRVAGAETTALRRVQEAEERAREELVAERREAEEGAERAERAEERVRALVEEVGELRGYLSQAEAARAAAEREAEGQAVQRAEAAERAVRQVEALESRSASLASELATAQRQRDEAQGDLRHAHAMQDQLQALLDGKNVEINAAAAEADLLRRALANQSAEAEAAGGGGRAGRGVRAGRPAGGGGGGRGAEGGAGPA